MGNGFVSIVGAGPWDPALVTVAAIRRLRRADVIVADYLVNPELLLYARANAEVVQRSTGPHGGTPLRQPQINALLVERAQAGRYVVRLKGGDPCMFGRGAEEAQVLARAGIDYEFVPGVSSPIAAPESAGIPVTHRDFTPAVTFVSGYEAYDKAGLHVAWEHLARSAGTLVLMMSIKNARMNAQRLVDAGRDAATPAAVVRWGTRGIQRTIVGTLGTIADAIEAAGIRAPATLVVGKVVGMREELAWIERRPLFGRRIVLTRGRGENRALALRLGELGADVVTVPSIAVEPPDDRDALAEALGRLSSFEGVIVSSKTGVRALVDGLLATGLDVRALAGKTVVAVGPTTASALQACGVKPDVVPISARSEGITEALAERSQLGLRWLHVRAQEGRATISTAISAAGGAYTLAPAYKTGRPAASIDVLRSLLGQNDGGEGCDAICFASGATAANFAMNLREGLGDGPAQAVLGGAALVSLGPVTTTAIERLGYVVKATATTPDESGLIAALRAALAAR